MKPVDSQGIAGPTAGALVGVAVVGAAVVGAAVGAAVVGAAVGVFVSAVVGVAVGVIVGALLGTPVGTMLGAHDGLLIGADVVGAAVGASVDPRGCEETTNRARANTERASGITLCTREWLLMVSSGGTAAAARAVRLGIASCERESQWVSICGLTPYQ